jgi:hypothetical protein
MNEPKRRGRPPKAKPCPECGQVGSHYDDCGAGITALDVHIAEHHADMISSVEFACGLTPDHERNRAQAYALRVWAGQHIFEPRSWRIQRVKEALQGQGLPFEGVELP